MPDMEKTAPIQSRDHAQAGIKAFFELSNKWQLSNDEARCLLGDTGKRTFFHWKEGKVAKVPADTMRRIGYIIGIHKGLRLLFSNPENVYGWLQRENTDFGGQSPKNRMLAGDVTDLAHVRSYLDSMRGGWS